MLNSRRLLIRPFRPEDRERFVGWHTREANRRFKWDGPLTAIEAHREFDQVLNGTAAGTRTYLAIVHSASGEPVGQIGLFPGASESEYALAYLIDEPCWGLGYATEASRAVIDNLLCHCSDCRVVAVIPNGHTASERVASKLGLSATRDEIRNGMPVRRWEADSRAL